MTEVLRLADVGRSIGRTAILRGIDLTIAAGERLAVLGASGSGKTTLLRLIAGLEPPTFGTVSLSGVPASTAGRVITPPERRGVAMVFQGLALFPHLRAFDQVAFAAKGRGGPDRARSLLARVGLGHRGDARLDELSGGERQRVALARALAQEPRLLLMDEPFASLDDERRAEMRDLLRDLLDPTETALILVTHSRDDALNLAGRALVLDAGRAVAGGAIADVVARPGHAAAVRALGLGQVVAGRVSATDVGMAETAFGPVRIGSTAAARGDVISILVRPGQSRLERAGGGGAGVVEVVAIEVRPPERAEVVRVALVQNDGQRLRVTIGDLVAVVGQRVGVRIEGTCDVLRTGA